MKTIQVSTKTWKRLMKWRVELNCKSLDELVERILKIVKAEELEK